MSRALGPQGTPPVVLEVEALRVEIRRGRSLITPVDGVSFQVRAGECLGLVGESGCGKTLTLRAIIGLLPAQGRMAGGCVRLSLAGNGQLVPFDVEQIRGHGIAMVFQEPMTALNPTMRVGDLIAEGPVARGLRRQEARDQAIELMREVGIPDPERRARAWPHELSGGLRQRVVIAMALSCDPRVLLCDEPTTALDVTIQDQILGLLDRLREQRRLSIVYVTHDLAVVSQIAHRVAVMYAGQIVETGVVEEVFANPQHPYTLGLLQSVPAFTGGHRRLGSIGGSPPDPRMFPRGCRFAPRCPFVQDDCDTARISLVEKRPGRGSACIHTELLEGQIGVAGK